MRWSSLVLALLASCGQAQAQSLNVSPGITNAIAPSPPAADNSNRIATTAFAKGVVSPLFVNCTNSQWVRQISAASSVCTQPTASDISGLGTYATASVGQLPGTTTNDNASAGNIGEYISSTVLVGAAVSLVSGTAKDITSISLPAGNWSVCGTVVSAISAGGAITALIGWTSTTSATAPTAPNNGSYTLEQVNVQTSGNLGRPTGCQNLKLASTSSVFLSTLMNFTGTNAAYGFISATRVR